MNPTPKDTEIIEYLELMRKEALRLSRRIERRDPRYTEALREKFGADYRDAQVFKLMALEWAIECMEWRHELARQASSVPSTRDFI